MVLAAPFLFRDITASAWSEEAKVLYDVAEIADWSIEVEEVAKVGCRPKSFYSDIYLGHSRAWQQ